MIKFKIVKKMDLNRELDRLASQVFYAPRYGVGERGQTWFPQIDIFETEDAYQAVVEIPGLGVEEIDLSVDQRHLQITGRRKPPVPEGSFRVLQCEIAYGPFSRTFRMPGPIDPDGAAATFDGGYLRISLPKPPAGSETQK